jgi:hypothetical protein
MPNRAEILKQKFQESLGLPFAEVLAGDVMGQVLSQHGIQVRQTLYTPEVALWAWLSQVLDPDKSLRNTVSRILAWVSCAKLNPPSSDTGAYCKARQRLPIAVIEEFFVHSVMALEAQTPPEGLWCGRRIKAYDGTTVTMLDTEANQREFPQHSHQKEGCGQPLAKLVVWFCVTTGAVLHVAIAAFRTSEWELSRELYETLEADDVALADSAYGTYVDLALVKQAGADGVFRKHHARDYDFRRGKRLGKQDHLVVWQRPVKYPASLPQEDFESLPETLSVREVHFSIAEPGFRTQQVIVVTTLLDPKRYPKSALADLYGLRWSATEVNLRHLKTTLKMEMIVAKTPETVIKELWMHMLAYNLLRLVMGESARQAGIKPLRVSLQGTRQLFNHFCGALAQVSRAEGRRLYQILLQMIHHSPVPLRPHRVEPRVTKRRPKNFPRMQQPRSVLKARLIN